MEIFTDNEDRTNTLVSLGVIMLAMLGIAYGYSEGTKQPTKKRRKKSTSNSGRNYQKKYSSTRKAKGASSKGLQRAGRVRSINAKIKNNKPLSDREKSFKSNNPHYKWEKR